MGNSVKGKKRACLFSVLELQQTFIALGLIFVGLSTIITIGASKSIVNPVRNLINAAERISEGDLNYPVPVYGEDEIGALSRSFERMRKRLFDYTESIKKYNLELERLVMERTLKIRESKQRIQNLLKKVITSQEDEQKRISRELHDETLQDLSAILMRIDMCRLYPQKITIEKIEEIRQITLNAIDGVFSSIQNMRPTVLDDLGLEAAIRWLLNSKLKDKGIEYFIRIDDRIKQQRLPSEIEIVIFRIIQEAVTNIARHSNAENAFVNIKILENNLAVEIEDDGDGFDIYKVFNESAGPSHTGRGLGLLGMKERASLNRGGWRGL